MLLINNIHFYMKFRLRRKNMWQNYLDMLLQLN